MSLKPKKQSSKMGSKNTSHARQRTVINLSLNLNSSTLYSLISDISYAPTGRSWNEFTFALIDKNLTRNQEEKQRPAISTSSSSILGNILGRIQEGRSICAQSCVAGFPCAATSALCTSSASTSTGGSVPSVPVPIDINPSECQTGLDCLGTYHNACLCFFAWTLKKFCLHELNACKTLIW